MPSRPPDCRKQFTKELSLLAQIGVGRCPDWYSAPKGPAGTAFPIVIAARPSMMAAKAARKMNLMVLLRVPAPLVYGIARLPGCRGLIARSSTSTKWAPPPGKIILNLVIRLMRKTDRKGQCLTYGTELNCDCRGPTGLASTCPGGSVGQPQRTGRILRRFLRQVTRVGGDLRSSQDRRCLE